MKDTIADILAIIGVIITAISIILVYTGRIYV